MFDQSTKSQMISLQLIKTTNLAYFLIDSNALKTVVKCHLGGIGLISALPVLAFSMILNLHT